jgi:inositol-pentakisphosphate 2-kinase
VQDDRPKFNYIEQERYYRTRIRPILGPHVLHQELVIIRNSGIIDAINGYLTRNDKKRKPKFMGTIVDQSDWGFLVEDMRPDGKRSSQIHAVHSSCEFKGHPS